MKMVTVAERMKVSASKRIKRAPIPVHVYFSRAGAPEAKRVKRDEKAKSDQQRVLRQIVEETGGKCFSFA